MVSDVHGAGNQAESAEPPWYRVPVQRDTSQPIGNTRIHHGTRHDGKLIINLFRRNYPV